MLTLPKVGCLPLYVNRTILGDARDPSILNIKNSTTDIVLSIYLTDVQ